MFYDAPADSRYHAFRNKQNVAKGGVVELMTRQKQGYAYIRP
jgi:intracellular sulfur oxidation DsrE/DsrF family protein